MDLDFVARTDVGQLRALNEDNFLIDPTLQLYVVCDGMGGHQGGEVASATAVNIVRATLAGSRSVLESFRHLDGTGSKSDGTGSKSAVLALLDQAVQKANARIYERGQINPSKKGMGTTLSLLLLLDDTAFIAHVGDSRVYRWRSGKTEQLTRDHSYFEEMKSRQPEWTPAKLDQRLKNAITRAVGGGPTLEVDLSCHAVRPGDLFLLCSDGLCGYFGAEGAAPHLGGVGDLGLAADGMIAFANDLGGEDNITALMVRVEGLSEPSPLGAQHFETLKALPALTYLSHEQLKVLLRASAWRELAKGENLEAAHDEGVWFVVSGGLTELGGGSALKRFPGSFVGLLNFVSGQGKAGDARALEASQVLFLPGSTFREWTAQRSELALKISHAMLADLGARLVGRFKPPKVSNIIGFAPWPAGGPAREKVTQPFPKPTRRRPETLDSDLLEESRPSPPLPPQGSKTP